MGAISAALVKELRGRTDAPMMDCKQALVESDGDLEAAQVWLRTKGLSRAASKAGRSTKEGIVEAYVHSGGGAGTKLGVLLELGCESDFVAKTDEFRTLAREIALQVAGASPRWVRREDVPADFVERESAVYRTQVADKPPQMVDKIVSGKLDAFYAEVCLLDQPWIRDEKRKKKVGQLVTDAVAKLGENITVVRFARFQVGETASETPPSPDR